MLFHSKSYFLIDDPINKDQRHWLNSDGGCPDLLLNFLYTLNVWKGLKIKNSKDKYFRECRIEYREVELKLINLFFNLLFPLCPPSGCHSIYAPYKHLPLASYSSGQDTMLEPRWEDVGLTVGRMVTKTLLSCKPLEVVFPWHTMKCLFGLWQNTLMRWTYTHFYKLAPSRSMPACLRTLKMPIWWQPSSSLHKRFPEWFACRLLAAVLPLGLTLFHNCPKLPAFTCPWMGRGWGPHSTNIV